MTIHQTVLPIARSELFANKALMRHYIKTEGGQEMMGEKGHAGSHQKFLGDHQKHEYLNFRRVNFLTFGGMNFGMNFDMKFGMNFLGVVFA